MIGPFMDWFDSQEWLQCALGVSLLIIAIIFRWLAGIECGPGSSEPDELACTWCGGSKLVPSLVPIDDPYLFSEYDLCPICTQEPEETVLWAEPIIDEGGK